MTGPNDPREVLERVLAALVAADPIETGLDEAQLRDEYGLEAGMITRRIIEGEEIKKSVSQVFKETGLKLNRKILRDIVRAIRET